VGFLSSPYAVLAAAVVGFLARSTRLGRMAGPLGKANIYFFLTAVLANSFYRKGIGASDAQIALSFIFFFAVSYAVLSRALRGLEAPERLSAMTTSIFPNAVNLAFPLLSATRGDYSYASSYALTVILVQSLSVPALGRELRGAKSSIGTLAPVSGIALGLALRRLSQSGPLPLALSLLSDVGILMFSFVAGLSIPRVSELSATSRVLMIGAWRFLASPALHAAPFAALSAIGFSVPREALAQAMVESVMPPALVNISYAIALGFDVRLASSAVVLLTPLGALAGTLLALCL